MQIVIGSSNTDVWDAGEPFVFSFIDNPAWRDAIYSITSTVVGSTHEEIQHFRKIESYLISELAAAPSGVQFVWTIKATDYPDTIVTVTLQ